MYINMPHYKYSNHFKQDNNALFDQVHHAGEQAPVSGIYRCEGCGIEAVSTRGHHLPPQNHHQHNYLQGTIRWKLNVMSTHA
jgi:hypothetical protein